MDLRDKAVGGSAVVEFCIRQIERELADARREAEGEGLPGVVDGIHTAQRAVHKAHRRLEELRAILSTTFGSPDASRSGGDDKPEDPPPGGG